MDNLIDQKVQNQQPADAGATELRDNDLEEATGGAMYSRPGITGPVNPLP